MEWRDVVGWLGYKVSDSGLVESWRCKHGTRRRGRLMSPVMDTEGYLRVSLSDGVRRKTVKIHTMVLTAFRGPRPPGMQARHLDDDKRNNLLSNLQWGTHSENVSDAMLHGRIRSGERHWRAKLKSQDVKEIRRALAGHEKHASLALRFGVTRSNISLIASRRAWRDVEA